MSCFCAFFIPTSSSFLKENFCFLFLLFLWLLYIVVATATTDNYSIHPNFMCNTLGNQDTCIEQHSQSHWRLELREKILLKDVLGFGAQHTGVAITSLDEYSHYCV